MIRGLGCVSCTGNYDNSFNLKTSYISRIRRNLSIHIARFSASESLRAYTTIHKISPPFASSKGVPNRESPASVKAHVPVSHMVILSLLALRSDVSIIAHALFHLFLLFLHLYSFIFASAFS